MKRFFFQLKTRWLRPGIYKAHQAALERMRQPDLPAYNFQKRRELVAHAREHSPFYWERYAGLQVPGSEAGFQKLPVITREDLRGHFERVRAGDVAGPKVKKLTTSGTTGPPLSVLQDQRVPLTPLQWRLMGWWGVQPWEDQAFVHRTPQPRLRYWLNHLLWWPTRRVFLQSPEPTPTEMDQFIAKCRKVRPVLLQGYVDLIYKLAVYILENEQIVPEPKAIWVTAGPLSDQKRYAIEAAFGAPVYDQYGATESFYMAAECGRHDGLHIMEDVVYIEVLDERNAPLPEGSWGKIVITDLHNRAFPLIRYEIGDYGRLLPERCACGVGLKRMDAVKGRRTDVIRTPSGKAIYADFLAALFDQYPNAVKSYQLGQQEDYSVALRYVPMNGKSVLPVVNAVVQNLAAEANHEISIQALEVRSIEAVNGKTPLILQDDQANPV